jgi:FkbM family methyltransferase
MSFKHLAARLLLPLINRVAGLASLKVVTLGTPNRDFGAFFRHLERLGTRFRTVIDVGVAFGTPALYESHPDAKFYLIEPVPSCRDELEQLAARLGGVAFNVAAGAADGVMDFFVHPDVSGSSAKRQLEGEYFDGVRVEVPVRRLDSLIREPIARPCLLKIDTQGAEIEVLEGASGILSDIDVVIIEVSFHQFREGAPEFHQIVERMSRLGFLAYEILEGHFRSADNALAQVDIAFVPENSALRAIRTFFSPEQARRYLKTIT